MRFAIELSRSNVKEKTGGPFGALVCDSATGEIISAGVNTVVSSSCSIAHADIIAIALAQCRAGTFDLGSEPNRFELVSSCEPCAMCFGAIQWSGVRSLVCGARKADAEAIGFDEGAKPRSWVAECRRRGVSVARDVLRKEAVEVLHEYSMLGRQIYNSRTS